MPPVKEGKPHYLKVFKSGNGRALTVTRLVPEDWSMVAVTLLPSDDGRILLDIRRMTYGGNDAEAPSPRPRRKSR